MTEPANWDNFRVEAMSAATFAKRNLIHWNLLREVLRRARGGILEVGVGSGAQSALVSRWGKRTVVIDNDRRIMAAARPNLQRFGRNVTLVAGDAFRLPFRDGCFGVAMSQGLMEHFGDADIASLLLEQLRVCRSVAFSVPSDRYPRQDVGNERLLTPARWRDIVRTGLGNTDEFRVRSRYYRADFEAWKYSVLGKKALGSFSVLVVVERLASV